KNLSTSPCGVSISRPASPCLRNSESTDPKRRSFVGSPFPRPSINTGQRGGAGGGRGGFHPNTPANILHGKASRDNHKKENDADQIRKPSKVQSPAATVKGSQKHFMSPTISAASKALAVSSRKKEVLVEPIRTSISFSGGKLPCMEGSVTKGLNQKKEVSFDSNVTYLGEDKEEVVQSEEDLDSKVDNSGTDADGMASLLETEIEEKDLVNLDPSFKMSTKPGDHSSTSSLASSDVMPPLSPLDADPYMKGRSGDLKDRFSAESLSNAEVTEDEFSSDGFHIETDDLSSDVASDDGSYKKEEEDMEVFEADHHTSASQATSEDAQLGSHGTLSSQQLELTCIYPPQLSNFARERFEQVTQRIQPLRHRYVSYLHKLILGFSQRHNMVALEYANLTSLLEDRLVDEASVFFSKAATFETGLSWPVTDEGVNVVSVMKRSHLIEATEEVVQGDVLYQESGDQEEIEVLDLDLSVHHTSNEAEEKNIDELVDKSCLEAALVVGGQDNSEQLVPDTFSQVEGIPDDSSATLKVPEAIMNTLAGAQERIEIPQEETLVARELESELDVTSAEIQDQPITKTREMVASAHVVAGIAILLLSPVFLQS
ncbi:unnamed protein product, partial [Linum tenue]